MESSEQKRDANEFYFCGGLQMDRTTAMCAPHCFLAKSGDPTVILAVDGDRCEHVLEKRTTLIF